MATSRTRPPSRRLHPPPLRLTPQAWLAFAVAASICFLAFVFISRQIEIGRRGRLVVELAEARETALVDQTALREQLASADDLDAIELEARVRLGLVLPGEMKVVFVEEP